MAVHWPSRLSATNTGGGAGQSLLQGPPSKGGPYALTAHAVAAAGGLPLGRQARGSEGTYSGKGWSSNAAHAQTFAVDSVSGRGRPYILGFSIASGVMRCPLYGRRPRSWARVLASSQLVSVGVRYSALNQCGLNIILLTCEDGYNLYLTYAVGGGICPSRDADFSLISSVISSDHLGIGEIASQITWA